MIINIDLFFYTCQLVSSSNGTELAASFTDGQIAIFGIGNPDQITLKSKIRHSVPPVALALCPDSILAGGSDMKIFVYEKMSGKIRQQFDFSKDPSVCDFTCAASAASGQTVVFGAINKLKIFHYQSRKKTWEEGKTKRIENLYIPTAIQWRKDGAYLSVATSAGTFHLFEATYKLVINVVYLYVFLFYSIKINILDVPKMKKLNSVS